MRWAPANRPPPRPGQVARDLAFAQAPAVVGVLYVLLVVVVGSRGVPRDSGFRRAVGD